MATFVSAGVQPLFGYIQLTAIRRIWGAKVEVTGSWGPPRLQQGLSVRVVDFGLVEEEASQLWSSILWTNIKILRKH